MKIALSLLSGVSYGGVTYYKNLIPALAKADKENEYHIFLRRNHPLLDKVTQTNFIFHECNVNTKSAFMRLFWEQFILPRELKKNKIDIIFTGKNANILFAPCKKIISIRNMEPLCYRNYKNHWKLDLFSWLRGGLTKMSIKKADGIIAVSKSTKDYLETSFPGIGDRVDIIYNGNPIEGESLKTNINKEEPHFLLSVSKFVTYANQFNLIKGYAILYQRNKDLPPLWLAGGVLDKAYFRRVKRLIREKGLTAKIKILGLISHEYLTQLYPKASGFLFPSTLEACPQTLIEAMACGVPITTSSTPPMPEICGDSAVYFDPFDAGDIANKIELLLTDQHLRSRLREKSLERSRFFDWEKGASELVKVFRKVNKL